MLKQTNSIFCLLVCFLMLAHNTYAQTNSWKLIAEQDLHLPELERQIIPEKYLTFSLDMEDLQHILSQAPLRLSPESVSQPVILYIPMPNGEMERFQIFDAPIMHPRLAARYPMIHSFAGVGLDDKTASLRFDVTQFGFHAMILSGKHGGVLIDPYSKNNTQYYISYFKKDFHKENLSKCFFNDDGLVEFVAPSAEKMQGDCMLRTYRLALACTGEYAAFHGGNLPDVMAAINTTMTRVNGIFERDIAVSMELVADNDELIFLNASSDPFKFFTSDESQLACDDIIGTANYDIGHLIGIGDGGQAERSSCCVDGLKGSGASTLSSPVGDAFDINFLAHEFGHQFGCSHIAHKECNNTPSTSVETGNGASVMGQDFFCDPEMEDVRGAYFHTINILEMAQNIIDGPAGSCPVLTDTGNSPPTVDGGNAQYTIPISTPFKLTAEGHDDDGEILTFNWEQMDNEDAPNPPLSSNTEGPAFRSYTPVAEPYRFFPSINYIVNGTAYEWEALPSVSREMNFRVTVRDNVNGAGCTGIDDVDLIFTKNAGPFLVQSPNTNTTWFQGSFQAVTWDVANTDQTPVNCSLVDILLSTDGGFTYPIILAQGVANDGSQIITVPDISTNTARVMVFCSDNVFFDISNENFSIEEATAPAVTISADPQTQQVCGATEKAFFSFSFSSLSGFNEPITLDATGIPAGANFSFSKNPITPSESVDLVIENLENVPSGNYAITVVATSASTVFEEEIVLSVNNDSFTPILLTFPENSATNVSVVPTFNWEGGINNSEFIFEIATTPGFGNSTVEIHSVNTNNYTIFQKLAPLTVYYWRIRSENICLNSTPYYSFQTGGDGCYTFTQKEPAYIPGFITTQTSTLFIEQDLEILDVNISMKVFHKNIGDLSAILTSPAGTSVELFHRPGQPTIPAECSGDNLLVTFDDDAPNSANVFESTCTSGTDYAIEGSFQALSSMANFNGENAYGEWTLTISDDKFSHAGAVDNWSLEFCFMQNAGAAPDFSKMDLEVPGLGNAAVLNNNLSATSAALSPAQIKYTLLALPTEGVLIFNGKNANIETSFTQEDINNGLLSYVNINPNATTDQFRFDILTSNGGWVQDQFLNINISEVLHSKEPDDVLFFELFPNPSSGNITLALHQNTAPQLRVMVLDIMGKVVLENKMEKNSTYLQQQIDLQKLPTGSYQLLLTDGELLGRKIFVKI